MSNDMPVDMANIEGINHKPALARLGSEDIYVDALKSFVEHTPALLEKITVVCKDNLADYAIIIHGIKGTSKAIGAETLGLIAEELEYAAKNGRTGFCITGNILFQEMARKLIDRLRDFLVLRGASEDAKEVREEPQTQLLMELKNACKNYEITKIDDIMNELEKYTYKKQNDLIKNLKTAFDVSDFSSAIKFLSETKIC